MGLNYSIELVFPVEKTEAVLQATAAMAVQSAKSINMRFPNDSILTIPVPSYVDPKRMKREKDGSIFLEMILLVPRDDVINRYVAQLRSFGVPESFGDFPLGSIWLYVRPGKRYVWFSYTASTSSISRLIQNSRSIHRRFLQLLHEYDGVLALLNLEGDERLLEYPELPLAFDPTSYFYTDEVLQNDNIVDRLLRAKAYSLRYWPKLGNAAAFYETWVCPLTDGKYGHVYGTKSLQWPDDHDLLDWFSEEIRRFRLQVTDKVIDLLLQDLAWRSSFVAAWYIALNRKEAFLSALGERFVDYPSASHDVVFALVYLGTLEAAAYLDRFLETHLNSRNKLY